MNYNVFNRLKKIQIENNIWIIYLGIILLSYFANSFEKDYFLSHNSTSKKIYRNINSFVFLILLIIYSYFEKESLDSVFTPSNHHRKYLDILSLIGSSAVLLSGIIFLYIILVDDDLEEEIAFN